LSVQASLGGPLQSEPENPTQPIPLNPERDSPKLPDLLQAEVQASELESEPQSTLSAKPAHELEEEPAAVQEPVFRLEDPSAAIDDTAPQTSPITLATSIMKTALHENAHRPVDEQSAAEPHPTPSDSTTAPSPHAETIAQLESWLRSIQRQRRDRVPSGDFSS